MNKNHIDKKRARKMSPNKNILIAYFSHSGTTETAAKKNRDICGGDLFEICPVEEYPKNYSTVAALAREELKADKHPALKAKVSDMNNYDVVIIGYPNWCGTCPMPVFSFLDQYDFTGKTVLPFCTHGGGGCGKSGKDIEKICPKASIFKVFDVNSVTEDKIKNWLAKEDIIKRGGIA